MLGDDLLSRTLRHTTIGAGAFHFRVRDGMGWGHTAVVAKHFLEALLFTEQGRRLDKLYEELRRGSY